MSENKTNYFLLLRGFEFLIVHFHRSMYYVPSRILKNFYAYHFIEWIDGLLSSMQKLRNIQKIKVGNNLLTDTSDSFTNFASTNLPIIFYENECCYVH